MLLPEITPELRTWIVAQSANFSVQHLLESMIKNGWPAEVAQRALETTLNPAAVQNLRSSSASSSVVLPEPIVQPGCATLRLPDREDPIIISMSNPRVVVLSNFLSSEECDSLIEAASPQLARSEAFVPETGGNAIHSARTSRGMFFQRAQNELVARIEARIAALTHWPIENGEGLQLLHYGPGEEYKPHYDYFDPAHAGSATVLKRGGQRVATVIMYLITPHLGGETTFPDLNLLVSPIKGNALFFSYDRPHASTRTLHGSVPVMQGEKWVATKWLRESNFV